MKKIIFLFSILFLVFASKGHSQLVSAVVSVGGEVYDAITKNPISVNIEVFDNDNKRVNKIKSNAKDGYYFITGLKSGKNYEVRVSELDYMKQAFPIVLPNTDKYLEVSKDLLLIPKKMGTEIPIRVKLFELNKNNLKFGAEVFLEDYLKLLKLNPTVKVRIVSYPDNSNDVGKNGQLTQERSESIKKYFLANGIEPDRVAAQNATIIDPKNPIPTGKVSKGKKYVGLSYLIIDAF